MASLSNRPGHRWRNTRRQGWAAAITGLAIGLLAATVALAPARWAAQGMAALTQGRLQLHDTQGTVWHGSGQLLLTGGSGSADARALAGSLTWTVHPSWTASGPALALTVRHDQAMPAPLTLHLQASHKGWTVSQQAPAQAQMRVPAGWVGGLGAPWNTLELGGSITLHLRGIRWVIEPTPALMAGEIDMEWHHVRSRVSTLPALGDYRFELRAGQPATLSLQSSASSALQLQGSGRWSPGSGIDFQGVATAAPGREEALANLLNIIGRREGARSIITL